MNQEQLTIERAQHKMFYFLYIYIYMYVYVSIYGWIDR